MVRRAFMRWVDMQLKIARPGVWPSVKKMVAAEPRALAAAVMGLGMVEIVTTCMTIKVAPQIAEVMVLRYTVATIALNAIARILTLVLALVTVATAVVMVLEVVTASILITAVDLATVTAALAMALDVVALPILTTGVALAMVTAVVAVLGGMPRTVDQSPSFWAAPCGGLEQQQRAHTRARHRHLELHQGDKAFQGDKHLCSRARRTRILLGNVLPRSSCHHSSVTSRRR